VPTFADCWKHELLSCETLGSLKFWAWELHQQMCENLSSNDCEAVAIYYQSDCMSSKNSGSSGFAQKVGEAE